MKSKLLLLFACAIFLNVIRSEAQVGKRWYSYGDYLTNTLPAADVGGLQLWNDTTGVYGYAGTPAVYESNNFTSDGMAFAPRLAPWNNVSLYGSTIKVGPNDAYTIDSVRIYGTYLRNNAKPLPKDTLRVALVYGNGDNTTNLPEFILPGTFSSYGVDTVHYLQMIHDSLHNIAGKYIGVVTAPYVQSIILGATDTSSNFGRAFALTTPYLVPAGNSASASLTFKTGDASYTPFDTIIYASGDFKYGDFISLVEFAGITGAPVFAPYSLADSNVGYFKSEGAADNWAGQYVPTWGWMTAFGASELQYPAVDFHINCPTCDLNDSIAGTLSACAGATSSLSFSLTGGTWSSSNTAVATVSSSGAVGGVSGGVVTITYDLSGHHAYTSFAVNPAPSPVGGTLHVCAGATTLLTDAPSGGSWSSGSPFVATNTGGAIYGAAPGTTIISYTLATTGCTQTAVVTVNAAPSPVTGTMSVCTGTTTTLADATTPGTWSSGSTAIASVVSSGVVTGGITGSATITYTSGGCSATSIVSVLSAPASAGTVTGGSVICAGATTSLADGITGGAWTSSNTGIATVSGSGTVSGVSEGSATITYTVSNICGSVDATAPMAVNPLPDPGIITGNVTICQGDTTTFTDPAGGGTWSSSNTSIATVSASGSVYGSSAGAANISYSVTNSCGTQYAVQAVNILSTATCDAAVKNTGFMQGGEVLISPNPNRGLFTMNILSQNDEEARVTITNIVGEKVKEFTATSNKVTDVKLDQAPGIYILTATTTTGRYVARMIIE